MQAYNNIKKFIAITARANQKNERQVRMSTEEATKLQAEISLLLLELKEAEKGPRITTLDGGKF